jgi:hypothetical protein
METMQFHIPEQTRPTAWSSRTGCFVPFPLNRICNPIVFAFLLLLSLSIPSTAQNYPVQVNVNVATPCPVRLSSLFSGTSSRVNLMVLLTDISQPELQVRLRVTLEGPGLTLTTRPEFLPIPFTLYGGMPVSLQTELAPYFTTTSLMASGSAAGSFTQSGMLPEGMYRLTVQAVEHRRNVVVSNAAMAMAWAIYNDPPEPILPTNNQVVDAGNVQNILFTWAPRHILTPGAGGQITYRLSLWEIPTGINPELAVQTLQPIGTIEAYSPTAIWGPDRPMLIPGKQYAYRIQAVDPTGEVAFKNSGNSVVRAFTFGTPCSKPVNLSHSEVTIQSAKTAWVPLGGVANFAVEYRPASEEPVNWRSYEVQGNNTTLRSLAPATEYKYRVKSVCGSYHSDPTAEKSFTTQPLPNLDNLCTGNAVAPPVGNAPLLNNLESLQVISAGGFLVTIDEVTRTAPYTFSGKCRIAMPLFSTNVKGTFRNIQVNSLLQLTAGKVESVKSETLTIIGGNGSNPNGPGAIDFGNITDTMHITGPIDNYHMNPDSTWTVVTTSGDTIIVHPPTNGTGVLVVDPNGNGIVIVGTEVEAYPRENNNQNGVGNGLGGGDSINNRSFCFIINGRIFEDGSTFISMYTNKMLEIGIKCNDTTFNFAQLKWQLRGNDIPVNEEYPDRVKIKMSPENLPYTGTLLKNKLRVFDENNNKLLELIIRPYHPPHLIFNLPTGNVDFFFDDGFRLSKLQSIEYYDTIQVGKNKNVIYAPVLGLVPNQTANIQLSVKDFPNYALFDENFIVVIKGTQKGLVEINGLDSLTLNSRTFNSINNITIKAIDFLETSNMHIQVYLPSINKNIGLLEYYCKPKVPRCAQLIYVKFADEINYPQLNHVSLETYLNTFSMNKLFLNIFIDTVKLESSYSKSYFTGKSKEFVLGMLISEKNMKFGFPSENENKVENDFYFITNLDRGGSPGAHLTGDAGGFQAKWLGSPYNETQEEITAHEFGHWQGLPHTFEINRNATFNLIVAPKGSTKSNFMDYNIQRRNWFKIQLLNLKKSN